MVPLETIDSLLSCLCNHYVIICLVRVRLPTIQGETACVAQIESFSGALPINQLRPYLTQYSTKKRKRNQETVFDQCLWTLFSRKCYLQRCLHCLSNYARSWRLPSQRQSRTAVREWVFRQDEPKLVEKGLGTK